MAEFQSVDLREITAENITVYFGSREPISAPPLAHAILEIILFIQDVSDHTDPTSQYRISIEEAGEGSFWLRLGFRSSVQTFLHHPIPSGVVVLILGQLLFGGGEHIENNYYIYGGDVRIVANAETAHIVDDIRNNRPDIYRRISRTFDILSNIPEIKSFSLRDRELKGSPLLHIPKGQFSSIRAQADNSAEAETRVLPMKGELWIQKAWFDGSPYKTWAFMLDGKRISANIDDLSFLESVKNRLITFGQGDCLIGLLDVTQRINRQHEWKNKKYTIRKVLGLKNCPQSVALPFASSD